MIQKKKKQIKIIIIALLILILTAGGTIWIVNLNRNNNIESSLEKQEEVDFKTKSLLLKTTYEIEDTYGAIRIEELMENMYVLEYETEEQTQRAYQELKKDDKIEYIVPDQEYETKNDIDKKIIYYKDINGEIFASWAGTSMGLDILQDKINQKTEVPTITIAVLDSGLDLNHIVITEKYLSNISENRYNAIDRGTDITDENGHGTFMTGAILDCAPNNISIIPVKLLNEEGQAEGQYIIRAINYAIEQNVDIINMSLGTQPGSSASGSEIALQDAIQTAIDKGIIVVAATGNGDENGIAYNTDILGNEVYPAAIPDVIAVGSVKNNLLEIDEEGQIVNKFETYKKPTMTDLTISTFSNYGSTTDFVAPGENIIGISPENLSSTGLIISSGTSQATAHMSAAIANILSYNKEFTNEQVYEILEYYAEDLGAEGKDVYYGNGFVNFNNIQECTCNCEDCDSIYCFGCSCEECIYHNHGALTSLEITTNPTKTIYKEGESFDPTGMVITAVYSDGTRKTVTGYTYSPNEGLKTTDTKITISYEGKTVELEITVEAVQAEKTLERIEVTTKPNKTTYTEGETFNPAGMVITAVYSDGTRKTVTGYTYSPNEGLKTTDTKITISYEGKTVELEITVEAVQAEKTLERIEVTTKPNKTTYTEGETFNPAGMVITAIYSDGSKQDIINYNCFPISELTTENKLITVSYTEDGKTVTTTLSIIVNAKDDNNSGDNDSNNNNNNNSVIPGDETNIIQIGGENNTTDNTTKDQDLAFTGIEDYIIPGILIITIIGVGAFIKYRQYKDI